MARTKRKSRWVEEAKYELYGLTIIILSVLALSETWGAVGRSLRFMLRFVAGNWEFLIPPITIGIGIYVMIKRKWPKFLSLRGFGLLLLLIAIFTYGHLDLYTELSNEGEFEVNIISETFERIVAERTGPKQAIGGGIVGAFFFMILYYLFGHYGTILVILFMALVSVMFLTGFTLEKGFHALRMAIHFLKRNLTYYFLQWIGQMKLRIRSVRSSRQRMQQPNDTKDEEDEIVHDEEPDTISKQDEPESVQRSYVEEPEMYERAQEDSYGEAELRHEYTDLPETFATEETNYQLPSYNLLRRPPRSTDKDQRDLQANAQKLEATLKSFGVNARVVDYHRGPAVTRYEVHPEPGVKVSRIVNLADDLALALAAKDIRIEAPIPGKSAVGIEVPNEHISLVTLREVLESSYFHENRSKLTVALGRDINGDPVVADLAKMPHLLVAGATGSGKSVCINSIIASLLYKAKPNEVKLMMIDPKMVELSIYNGIPHLLTPVVTDARKASIALKKVVAEMERRYEMFAQVGARDIERYNQYVLAERQKQPDISLSHLPYIVVIVDELADLMMVASSDVEDSITRLAQKARACGIHLILATQRPSVDVITGVIKANIPSRIAFGVSSQVDSRTILDMAGAEKLLGKGDMLYLPMGSSKVTRVQGCYIDDQEIEALVQAVKKQQEAEYVPELIPEDVAGSGNEEMEDELYERAVQLIAETQTASVSLIQRRLRVGYARAARLMDMMEQRGIVGPYEGSKPREVYIKRPENSNIS